MSQTRLTKYVLTLTLYVSFFALGLNYNIIAPTLTDLKYLLKTDLAKVSIVYTARSAGYLIGALLSWAILKFIKRWLGLASLLALMSATLWLMPRWDSLSLLYVNAAVNGISSGGSDAAINVWILDIWGEQSNPYMQGLHFCFSVGSAVAPLIVAPFLSRNVTSSDSHVLTNASTDTTETAVGTAYEINGIVTAACAVLLLVTSWIVRNEAVSSSSEDLTAETIDSDINKDKEQVDESEKVNLCPRNGLGSALTGRGAKFLALSCLIMTIYSGMEAIYEEFMPTLVNKSGLGVSPKDASFMNSAMIYAMTASQGLAILMAVKLRPEHFVFLDCLLLTSGTLVLLTWGTSSLPAAWLGNILLGAGFASILPSMYSLVDREMKVTNGIGSLFIFSNGLTAVVYPLLVGHYIEKWPQILIYLNLFSVLTTFALFLVLCFAFLKKSPRF